MIIQFHTPTGIVGIDTETVTDAKLAGLKIARASLDKLVHRGLAAEIDRIKTEVAILRGA